MTQKPELYVCTNLRISGRSCAGHAAGACGADVLKALRLEPAVKSGEVIVHDSVCMGYCTKGPNVKIMGSDFRHGVKPGDAKSLIDDALKLKPSKP